MKKSLIYTTIVHVSVAIILECDYMIGMPESFEDNNSHEIGIYVCRVKNLNVSTKFTSITGVTEDHFEGVTNVDVGVIQFIDQICRQLPAGIGTFFPNIRTIQIYNSSLEKITKDDLKAFTFLEHLLIQNNPRLKTLEADLFQYSTRLVSIDLSQNNVEFIGRRILQPLKSLSKAQFKGNKCIDTGYELLTKLLCLKLKIELESNCSEAVKFVD